MNIDTLFACFKALARIKSTNKISEVVQARKSQKQVPRSLLNHLRGKKKYKYNIPEFTLCIDSINISAFGNTTNLETV